MKRGILLLTIFVNCLLSVAQEHTLPEGWDRIIVDNKTAYMNLITGEVTLRFPDKPARHIGAKVEFDPTIIHKVKEGETLSVIARSYRIPLGKLYQLNSLTNFDELAVGQEVVIGYADSEEEKRKFLYKAKNTNSLIHNVKKGETLYSIAKNYGVTVEELKQKNKLTNTTVYSGQQLLIK